MGCHPYREETAMKTILMLCATALLAGACATTETQVAQAECKLQRPTTATYAATGRSTRPSDRLDQRYAEMQLAASDYRLRELATRGMGPTNTVEQALRDCDAK
jgi:hypothetical protein